ncbi:MAG: hypothetical protein L6R39_002941 [Caloplaca ligustica]|nr:MAG: hypothetical protein L6R39_002941 [Caloplaca ligustica]
MPGLPSFRYPGDGLDYRRPAPTSVASEVIDLTDDNGPVEVQPPSRSGTRVNATSSATQTQSSRRTIRDIIDLDEERTRATVDSSSQSPDLELVGVRRVHSQPTQDAEQRRRQGSRPPRSTLRPPPSSHPEDQSFTIGGWGALRQHAQGRERHQQLAQQTARQFHQLLQTNHPHPTADMVMRYEGRDIILPGDLDFVTQGFRMGDAAGTRQTQPPPPTYDAPSPPRAGFTRSPKEEDILVCPNCGDELGLGKDDVKRQVWVIKACGHVSDLGSMQSNPG